jgi:DNA-binding response OmpR family regulator
VTRRAGAVGENTSGNARWNNARTVLIVDDDALLRAMLSEHLIKAGFRVLEAASVAEAKQRLHSVSGCDAMILDVLLPDGDGRSFCTELRKSGFRPPILLLTGLTDTTDLVTGLDSGANDYIEKPLDSTELLARLRAHLRIARISGDADFLVGPFRFRQVLGTLERPDGSIHARLPAKEAAILKLLVAAGSMPVACSTILQSVWRERPQSGSRSLKTHISRLRQKLEQNPSDHRVIVKRGDGYLLDLRALDLDPATERDESNGSPQIKNAKNSLTQSPIFPPFRGYGPKM